MDAGNSLFRNQETPSQKGLASAQLLLDFYHAIGYMALCVGRQDLSGSVSFLLKEAKKTGLPLLSSNLSYKGKPVFEPYKIFGINGIKVGVLAVTSPRLSRKMKADGVEALNPLARIKALLPYLKRRTDAVILLSNLGEAEDRVLASTIDGIDLIIGSGPGKQTYEPLKIGKTYLLRTHPRGKSVGEVNVDLDAKGGILDLDNNLVLLNAGLPEDKAAVQKIQELEKRYPPARKIFTTTRPRSTDNPFLKALKEAEKKRRKGQRVQTNATVSNPFIEFLKKRSKSLNSPSKADPFSRKTAPEAKEPE